MTTSVKTDPSTGTLTNKPALPSSEEIAQKALAATADAPFTEGIGTPGAPTTAKANQAKATKETAMAQGADDPPAPDADDPSADGAESLGNLGTLISGGGTMSIDEMMPLLMAVLADAMKDKRADQQIKDMMGNIAIAAKAATLNKQSESIKLGMEEAGQKAEIAMNQAVNSMVMGVVMGCIQIGAAAASYAGGTAAQGKADEANKGLAAGQPHMSANAAAETGTLVGQIMTGVNTVLGGINGYMQGEAEAKKLNIDAHSKSSLAKIAANDLQITQNEAERADQKADEQLKSQKEHIQNLKDNFKKLLDMWSQMSQSAVNAYR